jgi:hypothetical protein
MPMWANAFPRLLLLSKPTGAAPWQMIHVLLDAWFSYGCELGIHVYLLSWCKMILLKCRRPCCCVELREVVLACVQ